MKRVRRELGVEYLGEGSLRKASNRLRVTAKLIEAATGNLLWAERYDRGQSDEFEIQDEVTQTIASEILRSGGPPRSPPGAEPYHDGCPCPIGNCPISNLNVAFLYWIDELQPISKCNHITDSSW